MQFPRLSITNVDFRISKIVLDFNVFFNVIMDLFKLMLPCCSLTLEAGV